MWLDIYVRNKNISRSDRTYHELQVLVEIFYVAGVYDQVNGGGLACLEVAARRIQTIVDAYAVDPAKPSWSNARFYSGVGSVDDLVSPDLRQYVARQAKEESDIESVRQKTRTLGHAAEAVATGGLPAGGGGGGDKATKGKPKGRGRGAGEPAETA